MENMLETPLAIGTKTARTRLAMAPVALEKSHAGTVSQDLLDYYASRTAKPGIGIVIVEHSHVRKDGIASPNQLSCAADGDLPGLEQLAKTIHRGCPLALMQISHAGAAVKKGVTGLPSISPSGLANPAGALGKGELQPSRAMTLEDIEAVRQAFAEAAARAMQAGFDGVEIHAAHGYLLNQFLSPLTNRRTDAYGGDLEGRTRLLREVAQDVRNAIGRDAVLAMRIGGCDYMEGGNGVEDAARAAALVQPAGLDLVDVSGGLCFFMRPGHKEAGYFSDQSAAVRQAVSVPVLAAGGVRTRQEAEALLQTGACDLVGAGRPHMASADWVDAFLGG
ncbi:MAG: NADH:flavin oxidoreductase [Desulfovibrio sp.]|nr:NADH:flavin oxidoreductase [Desulfovibrio sp.]